MRLRYVFVGFALAATLAPTGGLGAAQLVVPELSVSVLHADSGEAVSGVTVDLQAQKKRGAFYTLASSTTGARGEARFAPVAVEDLRSLGLRVSWSEPERPPRVLLYQFRTRKGKKTSGGRFVRPGRTQASHLIAEEAEGDCSNLFDLHTAGDRLEVTLRRPITYAACRKTVFEHADYDNVGRRNINAGALNLFPFERDVEIGRDFVHGLGPQHPPLDDPVVTDYVEDLVTRLARASDLPDLEFHVQVIDADVLNAFALPGGYIFVYRGLVEATETESELVGVLAHEIAHVTSRHGTEGLTSAMTKVVSAFALGGLLASEVTDDEQTRNLILGAVLTGTNFWVMGGTRKREAEADRLGAQYAQNAGYDPRGLASFFDKLSQGRGRKQTRLDQLFSDHPNDDVRVRNVGQMVDYFLPRRDGLITSSQRHKRVKEHLETLPPAKIGGEVAANALFSSFKQVNEDLLWAEVLKHMTAGEGGNEAQDGGAR